MKHEQTLQQINQKLDLLLFFTKTIFKKQYNLSETQYNRIVGFFEKESEQNAKKYVEGIQNRQKFEESLKESE